MSSILHSAAAVMIVSLIAGCQSTTGAQIPLSPTPVTPVVPTPQNPANNTSFATLLNNVRLSNGSGPVTYDARLGRAAELHAQDMVANDYFSHTGQNGSTAGDRISAQGYQWRTYGENIAQGQATQQEAMDGWTNSPGHHANNINPAFENFGLGRAGDGADQRWVLVLGAER